MSTIMKGYNGRIPNPIIASPTTVASLPSSLLGETLSFLGPEGLSTTAKVCRSWHCCIDNTNQWKKQLQYLLSVTTDVDLNDYLPNGHSYKDLFKRVFPHFFGKSFWQRYIGDVGRVPPIPKEISLKKWFEVDPCNSTKTIGEAYVWMYLPSYIETNLEHFSLNGPDDPTNLEAPRLIENTGSKVSKVPVTINNIEELFKRPKTGYSSCYFDTVSGMREEIGNNRNIPLWLCMRKDLIGNFLTFDQQKNLAKTRGVVIVDLIERIAFNFLQHVRSNVYPDGANPSSFARTKRMSLDPQGVPRVAICGWGSPEQGLFLNRSIGDAAFVGLGVALSTESSPMSS